MIVSIDALDSLDALIWLRTGEAACRRLGTAQPTISRRVRQVIAAFDLRLHKQGGEWSLLGDQSLLAMERLVHQHYRWRHQQPLRIEAQYFSGPLYCEPPPAGWIVGNFDFLEVHTPLRHLRTGVIDAWIACHPDVPPPDDGQFACFPLTRLPTHLVVAPDHPLLQLGEAIRLDDVRRYPSLALPDNAFPQVQAHLHALGLWNLTASLQRYDKHRWEGRISDTLVVGYASAFSLRLFDSPQVVLPLSIDLEVGDTLVVRRDFADHPRLQQLLAQLRLSAVELARLHPEVRLP